jgi:hypothetical protein
MESRCVLARRIRAACGFAHRIGVPATIRAAAAGARDGRAAVAQLIRWPRTL